MIYRIRERVKDVSHDQQASNRKKDLRQSSEATTKYPCKQAQLVVRFNLVLVEIILILRLSKTSTEE